MPATADRPGRSHTASWAKLQLGEPAGAASLLERARAITEGPEFDDLDRAAVLFQLGCCRLNLSEVANATSLLTLALELCDRSGRPCDRLRARALDWRSRCYQRRLQAMAVSLRNYQ